MSDADAWDPAVAADLAVVNLFRNAGGGMSTAPGAQHHGIERQLVPPGDLKARAVQQGAVVVGGAFPPAYVAHRQWWIRLGRAEPEDEFLAGLAGFAVLALVPPCDGLPRYTNGSPGGYVEEYSFRAQFLHDCADELGEDLLAAAYESKLPEDLMGYGRQLIARTERLAREHGLDRVNPAGSGHHLPEVASVAHKVDVMHSAGRWCVPGGTQPPARRVLVTGRSLRRDFPVGAGGGCRCAGPRGHRDTEVAVNVGPVSGGSSSAADLTRLVVAAQTARQPQPQTSVAVEALELRNVKAVASGTLDTYA